MTFFRNCSALCFLAAGCSGIFTDRDLPSLDARADVHPDGADAGTEADTDIGGEEVCTEPFLMCDGECVDPRTDRRHCGQCGHACSALASCMDGVCSCSGDRTDCGGACVDTNTDSHNCGSCGNVCDPGQVCNGAGVCAAECLSGLMRCDPGPNTYCADTRSDPLNCGGCHVACGPYERARPACSAGVCELACDEGYGDADGQIDNGCECAVGSTTEICNGLDDDCDGNRDEDFQCIKDSTELCTPPGTSCPGTRTCGGDCTWGACAEACEAPTPDCCWEGCTDLSGDPLNCGSCHNPCSDPALPTCCTGSCQNCNDGNPCTGDDICHSFGCMNEAVSDMTLCPDGVCCGGICRVRGNCCSSGDCPRSCAGLAAPCDSFDQAVCPGQSGCSWSTESECTGEPASCDEFLNSFDCGRCNYCAWTGSSCEGSPQPCASFTEGLACWFCGCTWGQFCSGIHGDCSSYGDEATCSLQRDCFWSDQCDPNYHCI